MLSTHPRPGENDRRSSRSGAGPGVGVSSMLSSVANLASHANGTGSGESQEPPKAGGSRGTSRSGGDYGCRTTKSSNAISAPGSSKVPAIRPTSPLEKAESETAWSCWPLAYSVRLSPMQSARRWLLAAPWLIDSEGGQLSLPRGSDDPPEYFGMA